MKKQRGLYTPETFENYLAWRETSQEFQLIFWINQYQVKYGEAIPSGTFLAEISHMESSRVSIIINLLGDRGLIKREKTNIKGAGTGRGRANSHLISLTPKGLKYLEEYMEGEE